MNIAALFIRRPVTTTLVMLAILLFGAMSFRLLPVSDLPNVDFPTIQVSANLPGASAETMASTVATGISAWALAASRAPILVRTSSFKVSGTRRSRTSTPGISRAAWAAASAMVLMCPYME